MPISPSKFYMKEWQVPLPLLELESLPNLGLTVTKILPYMDGLHYVWEIAKLSKVSIQLVKDAIQALLYYKIVAMVDAFMVQV